MGRKPLAQDEMLERQRVGATIRALREARKLTADQLAAKVDKSRPYIANIEAGRKPLTAAMLAGIAAGLDVSPSAIVRADYMAEAS